MASVKAAAPAPGVDAGVLGAGVAALGPRTAVVTVTAHDGVPHRGEAAAFAVVSLDPPLALVTLPRSSRVAKGLDGAAFTITLAGDAATLLCEPWNVYDGGDHVIAVGEITGLDLGPDAARTMP